MAGMFRYLRRKVPDLSFCAFVAGVLDCSGGEDEARGKAKLADASTPDASVSGAAGMGGSVGMAGSGGTGGSTGPGGASGGSAGGTSGASAMDGGVAGAAGAGATSSCVGSSDGGNASGGTACNPLPTCWNKCKVGPGALSKAFADKNGKLYVGNGASYYTNAVGGWALKPLNSDKWAIDENGNPHTVMKGGPPMSLTSSGLVYSKLVGGTWMTEEIPNSSYSCPDQELFGGPMGWDVLVAPNGIPHVIWNRAEGHCSPYPRVYPQHAFKSGVQWMSITIGGMMWPGQAAQTSGVLDSSGYLHHAYVMDLFHWVSYSTDTPQSISGVLDGMGDYPGTEVVLAKPTGLSIFGIFSGCFVVPPGDCDDRVILTEGLSEPNQHNPKATLISCTGETGIAHALDVRPSGVVSLAWVSDAGLARFATNESGTWTYSDLGTGANVAIVVTSAQLNLFLEQGGEIFHLTPC